MVAFLIYYRSQVALKLPNLALKQIQGAADMSKCYSQPQQ